MTIVALLFLVALVLAAVSAFVNPPRVSLLSLAVAFLAAAFLVQVAT